MTEERKLYKAACHCGAVAFDLHLSDGFATIRRCSCSFCLMRGAVAVSAFLEDITLTQGAEALTLYQFNSRQAKHYFCKYCGIYTHHQRRSKPNEYGVNVACIKGFSPFDFTEVPVFDGTAHPSDNGGKRALFGTLSFTPSDKNTQETQ